MHLSQLLACALLLTLLSLWPSEAKPGVPAKVGAAAGRSGLGAALWCGQAGALGDAAPQGDQSGR